MKKQIVSHEYTCDVCGKPILLDELTTVKLPTLWNMGEEGDWSGAYEWHVHDDYSINGCAKIFVAHIAKKFAPQEIGK